MTPNQFGFVKGARRAGPIGAVQGEVVGRDGLAKNTRDIAIRIVKPDALVRRLDGDKNVRRETFCGKRLAVAEFHGRLANAELLAGAEGEVFEYAGATGRFGADQEARFFVA